MDVKLLSVEVSTSSCICLPFPKKNSSHADIFGCKRKVWVFSGYSFSVCIQPLICFSARGYPLSPAQKYGCLVVISGSVHVQLYLPSVEEKKISARGYFRSQAKSMDVQLLSIQLFCIFSARGYPLSPAQKYGCLVVIKGSVHV